MKARPILFSGPMVRALLDGRKTQTRRAVRKVDAEEHPFVGTFNERDGLPTVVFSDAPGDQVLSRVEAQCLYGQPGDLLWVRETFVVGYDYVDGEPPRIQDETTQRVWYAATDDSLCWDHRGERDHDNPPWKPSIHMPRWASRLTLELTEVRVERLQDISDPYALAEGVDRTNTSIPGYARERYHKLWEVSNGSSSWDANPWVWVLSFRVHHQNIDAFLAAKQAA